MRFRSILPPAATALVLLTLTSCDRPQTSGQSAPAETARPQDPEQTAISLPEEISFNTHIQPILSEYCYHCHGPDSGTREPKNEPLRLDRPEDAFALREATGKAVIIPGDPAASDIIRLMRHADPTVVMPPPEAHKSPSEHEIALVERWIEQGAQYEAHWAFAPVKRPEPPPSDAKHPVDAFIFQTLAKAGLEPNPPEDPRRFHRRLTLDLTGLPPEPAETDAFANAYASNPEQAVAAETDRLLATLASAEHFARYWLDAARYADTHGIHIDNHRAIWPYRDWVVRAFHENMPWDRFTIEQIAGDLLPEPSLDQLVATGFSRCLATTGEGGAIAEEYEHIYATDRVDTVGAVWLGLTMSCASCHDHKFDPVTMRDFYSMAAFFRNTTMSAMDGNNAEHPPNIFVPETADRDRWAALPAEISSREQEITARAEAAGADFETWLASFGPSAGTLPESLQQALELHLPLTETDGPLLGHLQGEPSSWPLDFPRIDGPLGPAPLVSTTPQDLGDLAAFGRSEQVSFGGFVRFEGTPTGAVIARMNPAESFRGWDIYLQSGHPAVHVIDTWSASAHKAVAAKPLEPNTWHHLLITFDGKAPPASALRLHVNGQPVDAPLSHATIGPEITAQTPLRLGSRANGDSKPNGPVALQDFRFYRRILDPAEISLLALHPSLQQLAKTPPAERDPKALEPLRSHFLANIDAESRRLRESIATLQAEQAAIRSRGSVSLIMQEKPSEPFAHILNRGVYSEKGEKVGPATPEVLPPMPPDAPKNRLGLARWLTQPDNPLPARVTMNRLWYQLFGTGIVETNEDFGIMGGRPSHPELLDWLAAEFLSSGWNHRHMVKLIATSATYRQSGAASPEKREADPANTLLSRGPRNRLDAEPIRDLALAAAGLLNHRSGGPPVKPYQPEGIWEAVAMPQSNTRHYRQDQGEALYRRSIYTYWKRTAAPPSMEILNAPSRETFCVRRERTNTPLQALVLMNDPQFVEASRVLAATALTQHSDPAARLDLITLRLLGRRFDSAERAIAGETLATAHEYYRNHPEEAAKIPSTGAAPTPPNLDPAELAAWALVASKILNLDETVTR